MTPEQQVKHQIWKWLCLHPKECFAWGQPNTGIYQNGKWRKRNATWDRPGVSDLVGVWDGALLVIEVKAPEGRPSLDQIKFLEECATRGGIAVLAYDVTDVINAIEAWKKTGDGVCYIGSPKGLPKQLNLLNRRG